LKPKAKGKHQPWKMATLTNKHTMGGHGVSEVPEQAAQHGPDASLRSERSMISKATTPTQVPISVERNAL